MQILKNDKGYITSYALVGTLIDGIEVPEPVDFSHFEGNFESYTVKDGELVYDDQEHEILKDQAEIADLRLRREKECFTFINRGQLWYATLSVKQLAEMTTWYKAWLKVTETKVVPERPTWLG